jgi:hypothetical protein
MTAGLEMLAGTSRPVGENQAKKKASHRGHRGHREGVAGGPKILAGTPRLAGENQAKERNKFNR